jgi:hypothetical protein
MAPPGSLVDTPNAIQPPFNWKKLSTDILLIGLIFVPLGF